MLCRFIVASREGGRLKGLGLDTVLSLKLLRDGTLQCMGPGFVAVMIDWVIGDFCIVFVFIW